MKTMNVIFAVIFALCALCALMALSAVIFCKAFHHIPICAGSVLMALTLFKTKNQ